MYGLRKGKKPNYLMSIAFTLFKFKLSFHYLRKEGGEVEGKLAKMKEKYTVGFSAYRSLRI